MPKSIFYILAIAAGALSTAGAAQTDTALTIYSSAQPGAIAPDLYRPTPGGGISTGAAIPGYALVRQDRAVELKEGRSTVKFTDVAAFIDPTTVQFSSLTDAANTRVLEQNFQFDVVSTQKLLTKYIDKQITLERNAGDNRITTLTGTLLSAGDGLVLRGADNQIYAVNGYAGVRFPELPGGLITKPTLIWDIAAKRAGTHRARVAYQTSGITWWADYNLTYSEGKDANSGLLDIGAWVSIINQSGATYPDARLKLIAGDVQRAQPARPMAKGRMEVMLTAMDDQAGFQEKSFFEFHLYTLGRRTTLPDNSTKQIELFDAARQVPVRKTLLYYGQTPVGFGFADPAIDRNFGTQMNRKVDVYLEFRNAEAAGLGMPLPAGRIRVAQLDGADQSLEFIGEDIIDHTPKNETVRVKLGSAFDVVGERRQLDFSVNTAAKTMEEEIEVKLRNHKAAPVDVIVKENLYRWTNWKILHASHPYEKEDARTIHLPVKVPRDGEAAVRYRVRYTW